MKRTIRKEIIARRNSLTSEAVVEKSAVIQEKVLELPVYRESKTIGFYASFNNEVSTSIIFQKAVEDGKKILFPCIRKTDKELAFFPVRGLEELESGPFGIMAPFIRDGAEDRLSEVDLLLIPGVSYDSKGGRIGYGGGFYDRTLYKLAKLPLIVALAYDFQIVDEVPVCSHDVRVDVIVTEKRVIVC